MGNEEFKNIVSILGLPYDNERSMNKQSQKFILESLNFNRLVIITDADFDGYAIRSLLLNFFFEYWPNLFGNDFIYIAESPLYEVILTNPTGKKETFYCINDQEFNSLMDYAEKKNCKLLRKKRNKGLGETSREAMKYAINNCLLKISLKNKKQSAEVQDLWFHKNKALERRKAISEYKQLYLDEWKKV